jgi:hypothetical protein
MSETTFEEASRCPKCGQPGEDKKKRKVRKGRNWVEIHTIYCRNQLCRWLDTAWLVQVNEDGSIPQAYQQLGDKQFPKLSPESETRVQEAMEEQLRQETQPGGGELRNPFRRG